MSRPSYSLFTTTVVVTSTVLLTQVVQGGTRRPHRRDPRLRLHHPLLPSRRLRLWATGS